jgi:hypothetical protein
MTYFLEKPFQNWSKASSQILGTVNFHVDYTADVDAFRAELRRILETEGKALWDGKVQTVAVTDSSDRTITLRFLVSSPDPAVNFDLRCLIRERLLALLRSHPQWLPVTRMEERASPTRKVAPNEPR